MRLDNIKNIQIWEIINMLTKIMRGLNAIEDLEEIIQNFFFYLIGFIYFLIFY